MSIFVGVMSVIMIIGLIHNLVKLSKDEMAPGDHSRGIYVFAALVNACLAAWGFALLVR